jgi:hypothetical protein
MQSKPRNAPEVEMDKMEKLACEFFLLFSKYEFALKALGYVSNYTNSLAVMPNWEKFAKEKGAPLLNDPIPAVVAAKNWLLRNPAKRQESVAKIKKVDSKDKTELAWIQHQPAIDPKDAKAVDLFRMIKNVRNNLHHGGKFKEGVYSSDWVESPKSKKLIECSLVILRRLCETDVDVGQKVRTARLH